MRKAPSLPRVRIVSIASLAAAVGFYVMAERVAETHGGTARVESEPGVGSSFVIELRRDLDDEPGPAVAQPSQ